MKLRPYITVLTLFLTLVGLFVAGCAAPTSEQIVEKAQVQLERGDAKGALNRLEDAYRAHPEDNKIMEALGTAHFNVGDPIRGAELLNTLALRSSPDFHLYAAASYKKAGKLDKAIEAYRLFLLSEPKQASAWNDFGETLITAGNATEGLAALITSHDLEASPTLARRIAELSAANSSAQTMRYLQNALKQARAKRPAKSGPTALEGDILADLAAVSLVERKTPEATRHIKQLERDFPKHSRLKELKKALNNPELAAKLMVGKASAVPTPSNEAEKEISKTVKETDEKKTEAEKTDGKIEGKTEEKAEVKVDSKSEAVKTEEVKTPAVETKSVEPKAVEPKLTPADTLPEKTEAPAPAIVVTPAKVAAAPKADPLMEAVQKDSANPAKWAALALSRANAGDYAWAEIAYLEAMRRKPADAIYTIKYLEVVALRRSPRETLDEAEKLLAKYPEMPELYLFTARTYRDPMKNNRNASILFKKFLEKFPNNPEVKKVQSELDVLPIQ